MVGDNVQCVFVWPLAWPGKLMSGVVSGDVAKWRDCARHPGEEQQDWPSYPSGLCQSRPRYSPDHPPPPLTLSLSVLGSPVQQEERPAQPRDNIITTRYR